MTALSFTSDPAFLLRYFRSSSRASRSGPGILTAIDVSFFTHANTSTVEHV